MPIYEYECLDCGDKFEKFVQSMKADPKGIECPNCGSHNIQKALSLFGVRGGAASASTSSAGGSCGSGST